MKKLVRKNIEKRAKKCYSYDKMLECRICSSSMGYYRNYNKNLRASDWYQPEAFSFCYELRSFRKRMEDVYEEIAK